MSKVVLVCILCVLASATGQRITTIHLDNVQYFISRMNPYSPELNYFLAYQYCRSLGLQLASFETKEKAESMTTYLKNAGYDNYDFWTSGNRLGTGMFLWMSTGLPFNATFDFFENSADVLRSGLLNPVDHNSNTSPQRTARDSNSGAEKGCVILRQPTLKWMPEDCSAVKDFICEQTRCYYYNYGSIPVSSAQGRPITSTTPRPGTSINNLKSTTPMQDVMSTYVPSLKKSQYDFEPQPSFVSLKFGHENRLEDEKVPLQNLSNYESNMDVLNDQDIILSDNTNPISANMHILSDEKNEELHTMEDFREHENVEEEAKINLSINEDAYKDVDSIVHIPTNSTSAQDDFEDISKEYIDEADQNREVTSSVSDTVSITDTPSIEVRLKQISQETEKLVNNKPGRLQNRLSTESDDIGRQSFLSLTDLIRTLRPNDQQIIPQIDSDYSNAMRVLGETSSLVNNDESRKYKDTDSIFQLNRSIY